MRSEVRDNIGTIGEQIVCQWLQEHGYSIVPASLMNTAGAPMLIGKGVKIILPDNLTWRKSKAGWVEVKTKSNATWHESWPKRWEHGLPLRQWVAYEVIQQKTQTQVSLAVLELGTKLLLLSPINKLKANERIYLMDKEYHIFLSRDDFSFYEVNVSDLPDPVKPCALRTLLQEQPPSTKQLNFNNGFGK